MQNSENMSAGLTKDDILKQFFGYDSFRPGQAEIVDNILSGRDVLGVMPTGAGKSICFQVPALMFDGITIVISPLISLMADQVSSLVQAGIRAAYINSSLTQAQMHAVISNAYKGMYKIIYIAPERLETDGFLNLARSMKISMITVDEAHCISHWGQDFRPSYLKITEFTEKLPYRPVISAFTATATKIVRDDIAKILRLNAPFEIVTGFDRKNLYFGVENPSDKYAALLKHIKEYTLENDRSGIVYCSTRKNVELVCDKLNADGIGATRYHAGLSEEERRLNQEDFICDNKKVMVATNAFGMGIDKSNVTYVIHYNMPKDVESYYQEAGRAGRDGSDSDCIILYSGQDVVTNRFLINKSFEESEFDTQTAEEIRKRDLNRLRTMTFYCTTAECLRSYILEYFGEKTAKQCGNCSYCCSGAPETDITVDAQKIMSCIFRAGQRYGTTTIISVLKGKKTEKLSASGLDKLTTYGIMSDCPEGRIRAMIDRLIGMGYIISSGDSYPVLSLSPSAAEILKGRKSISVRLPEIRSEKEKKRTALPFAEGVYSVDDRLLLALKNLRLKIAMKQRVPAYVIFSDASLRDMCAKLPVTDEEFKKVSGVGKAKLERYGSEFMEEIRIFIESNPEVKTRTAEKDVSEQAEEDPFDTIIRNAFRVDFTEEDIPITIYASNIISCTEARIKTGKLRTAVCDWLGSCGYLGKTVDSKGIQCRIVTERSEEIGIRMEEKVNSNGHIYTSIVYSPQAQKFILDNMDKIRAFAIES